MVSGHMSQGDLNSNLLPNTTFPIGNWKKRKNNCPKKLDDGWPESEEEYSEICN